jgi:hypothetical protein
LPLNTKGVCHIKDTATAQSALDIKGLIIFPIQRTIHKIKLFDHKIFNRLMIIVKTFIFTLLFERHSPLLSSNVQIMCIIVLLGHKVDDLLQNLDLETFKLRFIH